MPERVSAQTEQDQEGERERGEEREREGGGVCALAEEQVASPQEKKGASFCLLIGNSKWLHIGSSLKEDSLLMEYSSLLSCNTGLCCGAKEVHRKEGEGHLLLLPSYPTCLTDGTGRMIFDSHPATSLRSAH